MKKKFLLLVGMLCAFLFASAQSIVVDNAVKGTGLNQHNYVGSGWVHGSSNTSFYKSTTSFSNIAGAYVTFKFEGTKIEWYTEKRPTHGIVAISIDGGEEKLIDLFSGTEHHDLVYTSPLLASGSHTIKIRATGTKNAASTNYYAIHDYFIVDQKSALSPPIIVASNTVLGQGALASANDTHPGEGNTALGYRALESSTFGGGNTAIGAYAFPSATKTQLNTAIGYRALSEGTNEPWYSSNTAVGAYTLDTDAGASNTALGAYSGPIAATFMYNSTALGYLTKTTASDQVRIGSANVTSIGGQVSWSTLSDGRFKRDLREDVSGLEFVNKLRPVSYTVDKKAIQDFLGIPDSLRNSRFAAKEVPVRQTGFVAQEIEAITKKSGYVFSGVDAPKNEKDPYTIRYAEFVVPLVKAVQELSVQNDSLQKQINQLIKQIGKTNEGNSEVLPSLLQNNPNPFTVNTEIKMILPENAMTARIIVYNLEGKQLKDFLVKGRGKVSITILGNELSAGMYIYALIVDNEVVDTKRMVLTK